MPTGIETIIEVERRRVTFARYNEGGMPTGIETPLAKLVHNHANRLQRGGNADRH